MNKEVLEENALKDIGYILMKNDSKEKAYEYHEDDIGYCKVIKFEKLFHNKYIRINEFTSFNNVWICKQGANIIFF